MAGGTLPFTDNLVNALGVFRDDCIMTGVANRVRIAFQHQVVVRGMRVMTTRAVAFSQWCMNMFHFHLGTENGMATQAKLTLGTFLQFEFPFRLGDRRRKTESETNQKYNDNGLS